LTQGGQTKRSYQPDVGLVKNREEPMVSFAEVRSFLISPEVASSLEIIKESSVLGKAAGGSSLSRDRYENPMDLFEKRIRE